MTGPQVPFRIETTGQLDHEPGRRRRVLAVGRARGRGPVGIIATARRPVPAAAGALAAELAAALAEQQAAGPVARAGRAAWPQPAAS